MARQTARAISLHTGRVGLIVYLSGVHEHKLTYTFKEQISELSSRRGGGEKRVEGLSRVVAGGLPQGETGAKGHLGGHHVGHDLHFHVYPFPSLFYV